MRITGPTLDASATVERILRTLPRWFGIESALQEYVADARRLPTFVAHEGDAEHGFITLRQHHAAAWEVHCLGVALPARGQGIGRRLQAQAEAWLRAQGARVVQVKTLADTHPSPEYAETRAFYAAMGYVPLEVFPTLWGPRLPVLQLIKTLDQPAPR